MGFVTLGIFVLNAQGIEGAILQMVNHGITTGALFLCVGIIYARTHSRMIADNTGVAGPMPRYATFLVMFALSSLGLPGTNSFVGEFLVLVGTFAWSRLATVVAALGIILAAVYLLWMVQRVAFGMPGVQPKVQLSDLNWCEVATLAPLVALVFWIGFFPNPALTRMHASVNHLIEHVDESRQAVAGKGVNGQRAPFDSLRVIPSTVEGSMVSGKPLKTTEFTDTTHGLTTLDASRDPVRSEIPVTIDD
jgi:NADH-quinone oxidoreductase subunit M